jgi:hypothetical protein
MSAPASMAGHGASNRSTCRARRTEAVLDASAVGVVHEAVGRRDAVSRAVARDKLVATSVFIPR